MACRGTNVPSPGGSRREWQDSKEISFTFCGDGRNGLERMLRIAG